MIRSFVYRAFVRLRFRIVRWFHSVRSCIVRSFRVSCVFRIVRVKRLVRFVTFTIQDLYTYLAHMFYSNQYYSNIQITITFVMLNIYWTNM